MPVSSVSLVAAPIDRVATSFRLILERYGDATATRSGVPLINHIREGLCVLEWIDASPDARAAFCLHPFLQADCDLAENWNSRDLDGIPASTIVLAMEYRHIANGSLSTEAARPPGKILLSSIPDVNKMLVADKVQNFKDFRRHHERTHPRALQLDRYFRRWLDRLGVGMEQFEEWEKRLSA